MTPIIDLDGRVTVASAEAQAALDRGDTALAGRKHAEAAAILEERVAGLERDAEKSLPLFLAATQYYQGGHYRRAWTSPRMVDTQLRV